jgi:hypothetical protein
MALGRLTDVQALSHAEQERALEQFYREWLQRWRASVPSKTDMR